MMIPAAAYIDRVKDYSYNELIKERKRLAKEISSLERLLYTDSILNKFDRRKMVKPGPDMHYYFCLEYLSELCLLMRHKLEEERMRQLEELEKERCENIEKKTKRESS